MGITGCWTPNQRGGRVSLWIGWRWLVTTDVAGIKPGPQLPHHHIHNRDQQDREE